MAQRNSPNSSPETTGALEIDPTMQKGSPKHLAYGSPSTIMNLRDIRFLLYEATLQDKGGGQNRDQVSQSDLLCSTDQYPKDEQVFPYAVVISIHILYARKDSGLM